MICFKLLGSYWKPEGFSDNLCFSTCSPLCVHHFTFEEGREILKTRHLAISCTRLTAEKPFTHGSRRAFLITSVLVRAVRYVWTISLLREDG